ncbi:hypothetical protein PM082_014276 [Marasmius tenuissimus]|nr:hypothetical protein PM082_014276 [Marasmius tenuissimus]
MQIYTLSSDVLMEDRYRLLRMTGLRKFEDVESYESSLDDIYVGIGCDMDPLT